MIKTGRINQKSNQQPVLGTENLHAEQAILYKSLFDHMNDAVVYCKIIYDDQGNPADFILLDINLAFKRLTHIPEKIVLGKQASQILPILTPNHKVWMQKCINVAMTGKSLSLEKYGPNIDKWLFFNAYRPQKGYFAM
ncbi:MAG TPA: PAS domain-containing protein, partial [Candidatus Acidoferrales bacterium]|nr:PAS domain-containing protein [Candidatus Acidoferrales bacterium]